jgi:hypothetical protein
MRDVWLPEEKQSQPVFPGDYTMVAVVEGDDENKAYELTNHLECPWWENTGVTLIGEPKHRSTSVGDVVVMPDGRVLRVENAGWKLIYSQAWEPGFQPQGVE